MAEEPRRELKTLGIFEDRPDSPLLGFSRALVGPAMPTVDTSRSRAALAERKAASERVAQGYERAASEGEQELSALEQARAANAAERAGVKPGALDLPVPPSTVGRPFLQPGDSILGQLQTVIMAVGQMGMQAQGLRGSAIGAVASMKGMAEGWAAGDSERVKREYTEWRAKSDRLIEQHRATREAYQDLLEERHRTMEERLQGIRLRAAINGNKVLAEAARLGEIDAVVKHLEHTEGLELQVAKAQAEIARWHAQEARIEQARQDRLAQQDKTNAFRREALDEQKKTRDALIRKGTLKELEPFEKAGKLADGLNELEKIYTTMERSNPELLPKSGELFDAWSARVQRFLKPGDTSLFQMKMLWNQVIVGLLERGWSDEKGVRALAVFQSQINVQDQMPPPEALHGVMKSIRGLVRKGIDRDLKARQQLGASPEEMAMARMFTETLRDPADSELLDEMTGQFAR